MAERPRGWDIRTFKRREVLIGGAALLLGLAVGAGVTEQLHPDPFETTTEMKGSYELTIDWLPDTVVHYKDLIEQNAQKYDVDANLLAILMTIESGGYSKAGSAAAAKGLMQITPIAEGDIRQHYLQHPLKEGEYDIYKPATNIEFGAAFVNWIRGEIVERYPTIPDDRLAESIAMAYNGGLQGSAYPFLEGKGVEAGEAAFYGRTVRNMWLERNAARSPAYTRWRELDKEQQDLVGHAETEQGR